MSEYAKNTKRLSTASIGLRDTIAKAEDPEKTFFEDFPRALGYSESQLLEADDMLSAYIDRFQESIKEIRGCYDALVNRIELGLLESLGYELMQFDKYKPKIQERFSSIKEPLLLDHQKIFLKRINSALEERTSWLNSVVHSILGKSVDSMTDEDEKFLLIKFEQIVHELNNLCDIHQLKVNPETEEIIKFEFTSSNKGSKSHLIHLPRNKKSEIDSIKSKIRKILSKNKNLNITVLMKIIQEEIENE